MTALITPFREQKVDFETYEKLIKRQIANGIDAIVPVGTTGESATLTHNEHKECIEIAVATCKNTSTKVLAGAGSNATSEAIGLAIFAQKVGADGILSVTPYYNKPTQDGLFLHYSSLANSVEIPLMLYNVPGRTGVDIEADTAIRLHNSCKNIYAIKEASGSLERVVELKSKSKTFSIISGDDAINFPVMASGGDGCISVTSNLLPSMIADIIHKTQNKDYEYARVLNEKLYPINKALFLQSNPIPIKMAMYIAGLIPTIEYRLPLTQPNDFVVKKLEEILKLYEVEKWVIKF